MTSLPIDRLARDDHPPRAEELPCVRAPRCFEDVGSVIEESIAAAAFTAVKSTARLAAQASPLDNAVMDTRYDDGLWETDPPARHTARLLLDEEYLTYKDVRFWVVDRGDHTRPYGGRPSRRALLGCGGRIVVRWDEWSRVGRDLATCATRRRRGHVFEIIAAAGGNHYLVRARPGAPAFLVVPDHFDEDACAEA